MPHPGKGARLYLRPAAGRRKAVWIIRDGAEFISTGCGDGDLAAAEGKLAVYIAGKHRPQQQGPRPAAEIPVPELLSLYAEAKADTMAAKRDFLGRVGRLVEWWARSSLADINSITCEAYVRHRRGKVIARRELEDLKAAVNWHRKRGLTREYIEVPLPPPPPSRERWLTRSEAARLLWTMWRRPGGKGRHMARFVLVGLYTGTRATAILRASVRPAIGRGYIDYERGIFYRRAPGTAETKKRRPPAAIHPNLLAHMQRWLRKGISVDSVVEFHGQPIGRMNNGFRAAVKDAGLIGVTPHTLRHTAITWAMQGGADPFNVSTMFGVTQDVMQRVYAHHHPKFGQDVHAAMSRRR